MLARDAVTRLLPLLLLTAGPSCRRPAEVPNAMPTNSPDNTAPATSRSLPGRYACAIQKTLRATHALQRVTEDSTLSFVLELAAGGAATAWRGWRYQSSNDGPEVQTEERFAEQQGYRGRWVEEGGAVVVDLEQDDQVIAPRREFSPVALPRSTSVKLRCQAAPALAGAPSVPVLACEWLKPSPPTREREGYLVGGAGPGPRLVLGRGDGLRVRVTATSIDPGDPIEVRFEPAPAPIGPGAWERPF